MEEYTLSDIEHMMAKVLVLTMREVLEWNTPPTEQDVQGNSFVINFTEDPCRLKITITAELIEDNPNGD
jgi:hypothetical protein